VRVRGNRFYLSGRYAKVHPILQELRAGSDHRIDVNRYPELRVALREIDGWSETPDTYPKFAQGRAFAKFKLGKSKSVGREHLAGLLDELCSHLLYRARSTRYQEQSKAREPPTSELLAALAVDGDTWVAIRATPEIKRQIGLIGSLIDNILLQVRHANAPEGEQLLSEIERAQLIAILETALNVLKSPLAEKGLLKKAKTILNKGAESAAETGVQQGLGELMREATQQIGDLIRALF
jgi:hypothetical protein